jgi:hypothetical protein
MDRQEREPDRDVDRTPRCLALRHGEDDDHEERRAEELGEERASDSVRARDRRSDGDVVARRHQQQREAGKHRSDELRDPVGDDVASAHPPVEEHGERDDRVEVPSRGLSEHVQGCEQADAEGKGGHALGTAPGDDGSGADEHQHERAEHLGQQLL